MAFVLSKKERLAIFLKRLTENAETSSADEALAALTDILNAVENEFSGVPANPDGWLDDGRMYPPTELNRRAASGQPSLRRYRSARHNTFVGVNGSIRIEEIDGKILLNKAGSDGRKTHELDPVGP